MRLLRAAKIAAARDGTREYEVFEEALREHLGLGGALQRIWAGIAPGDALGAMRAERPPR